MLIVHCCTKWPVHLRIRLFSFRQLEGNRQKVPDEHADLDVSSTETHQLAAAMFY